MVEPDSTTAGEKLRTRTAQMVKVEEDGTTTALGIVDRDEISVDYDEETVSYENFGEVQVDTDRWTYDPEIEFSAARAVEDQENTLTLLGVRDGSSGQYSYDDAREWHAMELWFFSSDKASGEPDKVDRYEDGFWTIDGGETNDGIYNFTGTFHVNGEFYLGVDASEGTSTE